MRITVLTFEAVLRLVSAHPSPSQVSISIRDCDLIVGRQVLAIEQLGVTVEANPVLFDHSEASIRDYVQYLTGAVVYN